jgi:phosphatidylglycerophosphate synthase
MTAEEIQSISSNAPTEPQKRRFPVGALIGGLIGFGIHPVVWLLLRPFKRAGKPFPKIIMMLPNILTISRVFIVIVGPVFTISAVAYHYGPAKSAFIWLIALYVTDAFDGEVARFVQATPDSGYSKWGQGMDPIIDKIAGAAMLVCWGWLMWKFMPSLLRLYVPLAVLRAILDMRLAFIAKKEEIQTDIAKEKGRRVVLPKAGMWGKIKSTCDVFGVLFACYALHFALHASGSGQMIAGMILLAAATALAPMSIREHQECLAASIAVNRGI